MDRGLSSRHRDADQLEETSVMSPPTPPFSPPFSPPYSLPSSHQYQAIQPEQQLELSPSPATDAEMPAPIFMNAEALPWRPSYLKRFVLASFVIVFVHIIAVIEALLAVSNKNNGVATSYAGMHYLWTYGPTAFLTLFAATWSRVDYQAKQVAPWIRLCSRRPWAPAGRCCWTTYLRFSPSPCSSRSVIGTLWCR